jgi:hypothetical protein
VCFRVEPCQRTILGVLSLIGGVWGVIGLPAIIRLHLSPWCPVPQGPFAGLLTLGLPQGFSAYASVLASVGWTLGMALIAVGLLLRRVQVAWAGIVAFAPSMILRILLFPSYVATILGRVAWGFPPVGTTSVGASTIQVETPWRGIAALAAAAVNLAYLLWVHRETKRMRLLDRSVSDAG